MNQGKTKAFLKKHRNIWKAAVMSLLPLLCCVITCAAQGYSLGDVYLPNAEWNDELFYFKQTEGILEYGIPYGYFGFNESHALKLSFAAWSPVLLFPWLIWGGILGWNLLSPVYCNILLMMIAVFGYVLLAKPNRRQLGILTILFATFTPLTRFMLSGMPEMTCCSLLILFYGAAVSYQEKEHKGKLAAMFILSGLLTLMRPYLLLFMLLPAVFLMRRYKWKGAAGSVSIMAVTTAIYFAINHYLAAEYFAPLFKTEWVETFLEEGIFAGIRNMLSTLYYMGKGFFGMAWEGCRSGLAAGVYFSGYLAVLLVLLWQTWQDFRKKNRKELLLNGHMLFCFVAMMGALFLMYKLTEGSRHLITFIAVAIFAVSRMETRFFKKAMFLGAVFAYLFTVQAVSAYDFQVPFVTEERSEEVAKWQEILEEKMVLETENVPSYENVIIWTFSDETPTGTKVMEWQTLYAVPKGFGISCSEGSYVRDNFEELQSRYLAIPTDGTLDKMCQEAGYEELGRIGETVMYRMEAE